MQLRFAPLLFLASQVAAQNCGPDYGNQVCADGNCCSQYGWCDVDFAHCDPATCLPKWSGKGSTCSANTTSPSSVPSSPTSMPPAASKTLSTSTVRPSSTGLAYASQIPVIDVCGTGSGTKDVSCPGAGANGYFYRCCSAAGHCGPKNNLQDPGLYCGDGCQAGFGKCNPSMPKPPVPTAKPGTAQEGETCGPIVNKKCASGLCCSGSNFCGTGTDFCGAANWCQPKYGSCSK